MVFANENYVNARPAVAGSCCTLVLTSTRTNLRLPCHTLDAESDVHLEVSSPSPCFITSRRVLDKGGLPSPAVCAMAKHSMQSGWSQDGIGSAVYQVPDVTSCVWYTIKACGYHMNRAAVKGGAWLAADWSLPAWAVHVDGRTLSPSTSSLVETRT